MKRSNHEKKKVKGSNLKKRRELFFWLCKLVPNVKEKKELNIFLSFKFGLESSNYFKSIKLNFVPQNQELPELQDIFWTP
jgi:hypothetical protein